ncbi:MAG: Asp-tRNA(Asn)/Glu-tRNA(Gln) amidotransferase subunit GatC [Deltaproteobacteria bacterium]|nr:Asp-tRNA(Asn)/Glu-tRNA(Gln) amidotransferase subunit GatC [Deltaproteobacteria bacterium]
MKISPDELLHVARLARLSLDEADLAVFTRQVGDILAYVDTLNEADTSGVPLQSHAAKLTNAFREDEVTNPEGAAGLLDNVPEREDGDILVPKIIG